LGQSIRGRDIEKAIMSSIVGLKAEKRGRGGIFAKNGSEGKRSCSYTNEFVTEGEHREGKIGPHKTPPVEMRKSAASFRKEGKVGYRVLGRGKKKRAAKTLGKVRGFASQEKGEVSLLETGGGKEG